MKIHNFINAKVTRIIIFFVTLAFEALLGARIYFMVHGGSGFIQIELLEDALSGVVAGGVALLAAVLFVLGGYLRRAGQHYDQGHGKHARVVEEINEKGDPVKRGERYNRFPTAWWVNILILIVLAVEWMAIYITAPPGNDRTGFVIGYVVLSLVLPIIGHLLFASVNVPISSFVAEGDRDEELVKLRVAEAARAERLRALTPQKNRGWVANFISPPRATPSVRVVPDSQVASNFQKALPQGPSGQGHSSSSGPNQQQRPSSYPQDRRPEASPLGGNNSRFPDGM